MKRISRGIFAFTGIFTAGIAGQQCGSPTDAKNEKAPNFVILFADDLGYGDLGVFGNPNIKTPNLDRMASRGQKWTNFYVAAPVSTPSRTGLLTGRLPIRSGMCSEKRRVLFPDSEGGLPPGEITIASVLKENGYHTAAIGKWHLGHKSPYLPTDHGFESYLGIPYSNDMDKIEATDYFTLADMERYQAYNVPLMRNTEIIERPADQRTITKRYTEEAISQIQNLKDKPFFIYLAYSFPHIPLFRSAEFKDISRAGIYGDVVEEIDWSVGKILETLENAGIDDNTFVVFTSDNGPWLTFKTHGGSAGLLRGGKGGTFEGGMREPTVFWWPGKIKPGVIMEMATTMDLLPTICNLANIKLPDDRIYDGFDISPVIFGNGPNPRDVVIYYRDTEVFAVRKGPYKAHFITQPEYGSSERIIHDPPLLYNLDVDPSEKFDIAQDNPVIIAEIRKVLEEHLSTIIPVENQLEK